MAAAVEVVRMTPGAEAARQATDLIQRQLREMSRLVEDLVDAKRLACGKVSLQRNRLDLAALMREAAADVSDRVAERGQSLVIYGGAEPMWVDGDPQRLRQVLLNLLRNAATYTPCGGLISLGIARNRSAITVRVGDTGKGIEAVALPHVFDLFSQASPQEGTGLGVGLNIAREIVLLHGGSIEARSEGAGMGSEFTVRLPPPAIHDRRRARPQPRDGRGTPERAGRLPSLTSERAAATTRPPSSSTPRPVTRMRLPSNESRNGADTSYE
jgi:signal transduction histidine kinase